MKPFKFTSFYDGYSFDGSASVFSGAFVLSCSDSTALSPEKFGILLWGYQDQKPHSLMVTSKFCLNFYNEKDGRC